MYSFKKFISEAIEDYDKISDPKRKEELIKYHNDMSNEHDKQSKEHLKAKTSGSRGLEHSIAAEAHKSAAQLHHFTASALKMNLQGANDFRIRAANLTKGANARSELANKS